MADELGIEVKVPRLCKRQTHGGNVDYTSDPSDYYILYKANIAISFLDYLYQDLSFRFLKDNDPSYIQCFLWINGTWTNG